MSTFSAPLRVKGPVQDGDQSNAVDAGDVIVSQTNTMVFGDTTKSLFSIPGNSQIIDFNIDVTTGFNSSGTDNIDIGVTGDGDRFVDNAVVETVGRVLGSASSSSDKLVNYADIGPARLDLVGEYIQGGGASTGAAQITVLYTVRTVLPA